MKRGYSNWRWYIALAACATIGIGGCPPIENPTSALEQPGAAGDEGGVVDSGDGTLVGQIVGKLALIALVTDESRLIAYVCDGVETGKTISQWYEGDIREDGYFWLEPAGDDGDDATAGVYGSGVLWGTIKDGFASGELAAANDENLRWFAKAVGPDSPGGLYVNDDGDSVTAVVVLNESWGQGLSRSRRTGRSIRVAPPRRMTRARDITVRTRRRSLPVRRVRTPIRLVDTGLVDRFRRPPPSRVPDPGVVIPAPTNTIQVKFREGLRIRLAGGRPQDSNRRALRSRTARDLLDTVAGGRWSRSHTVSPGRLDDLRRTGEERTGKKLPDLNLYYTLRLPPRMNARVLVNLFKRLPEVEEAWIMPEYVLAAPDYDDPDIDPQATGIEYQQYLDPAPNGVDARYAWGIPGGNVAGVNVFDIEHGFNPLHVDLPDVQIRQPWPFTISGGAIAHGTAVLGIIAGLNDDSGITGIAHGSSMYFHSILGDDNPETALQQAVGLDGALLSAVLGQNAERGDVIVLEMQARGPSAFPTVAAVQGPLLPVEWYKPVFDAIRIATANGIVVVEAAGNSNYNLDAEFLLNHPEGKHQPFRMAGPIGSYSYYPVNDSGAIIVGAGTSGAAWSNTLKPPHIRSGLSNYGGRVDLHAWGDAIVTLGDGGPQFTIYDGGPNDIYRNNFAATSGATAIVGGTVAAFQGFYKVKYNGSTLNSISMRNILRGTGTPQVHDPDNPLADDKNIGPMPNLRAAIEAFGVTPEPPIEPHQFGCVLPTMYFPDPQDCQGETPLPVPRFSVRSGVIAVEDLSLVRPMFPDLFPDSSLIQFTLDGSLPVDCIGACSTHDWTIQDTNLCNSLASPDAKFEGVAENFTEPLFLHARLFNDASCPQPGAVSRTVKAVYVPQGYINQPVFDRPTQYEDDLEIHMTTGYPNSYPDGYAFVAYTLDGSEPVYGDDALYGADSPVWDDGYDDAGLTIEIFAGGQTQVTLKARVYLRVDSDTFVGGEVVQWTYPYPLSSP